MTLWSHFRVEPVDPLKDLEPMAASMTQAADVPAPPSAPPAPPGEFRGLEWYLKTRAAKLPPNPVAASAPPAPTVAKPERSASSRPLLSPQNLQPLHNLRRLPTTRRAPVLLKPSPTSDRRGSRSPNRSRAKASAKARTEERSGTLRPHRGRDHCDSEDAPRPRSRLKGAIVGAVLLAACAILSAPQAPWHPKMRAFWAHGQQTLHGWLNPQPVTPVQAPVAHENFGRAGDEYKMPVSREYSGRHHRSVSDSRVARNRSNVKKTE